MDWVGTSVIEEVSRDQGKKFLTMDFCFKPKIPTINNDPIVKKVMESQLS